MKIVPAHLDDIPELLEVQYAAYREEAAFYDHETLTPLLETAEEVAHIFPEHSILKAVDGEGKLLGSVRGRQDGNTCYIGRLSVRPEAQGQGLGRALVKAIEDLFSGVSRFELFTGQRNPRTLLFYKKLGYTEYRRKPVTRAVTLVYMEKIRSIG